MPDRPKVGVGVAIIKDGKVLLGQRKNAHGEGSWAFPGGHLEYGESWEECAKREVFEETGIEVKNVQFGAATNDIFKEENKHYITISMVCEYDSGEVKVMEPEKCEKWEWFEWKDIPKNVFVPLQNLAKKGYDPLEALKEHAYSA